MLYIGQVVLTPSEAGLSPQEVLISKKDVNSSTLSERKHNDLPVHLISKCAKE